MVRVCDGRMSGTAYGTVVLHVAPEAAVGGPLALVRTGDPIVLDVAARRLDLDVPPEELPRRDPVRGRHGRLRRPAARLGSALRRPRAPGRPRRRPGLPGRRQRLRGRPRVALTGRFGGGALAPVVHPRLPWAGAGSDLERELGQAAGAAAAAVAGPAAARRRLPAGDQARRRRLHRAARRGARRAAATRSRCTARSQWNGVAILSRVGLDDVVRGVAGAPGFPHPEARAVAATCGGVRVHSVYVPERARAGLRPLPLQAGLAGRAARRASRPARRPRSSAAT